MNNESQSQGQLPEPSTSVIVSLVDYETIVRGLQVMVNVNHQIAEDYKQQLITCRNLRELDQQNYSRLQAENDRLEKENVNLKNQTTAVMLEYNLTNKANKDNVREIIRLEKQVARLKKGRK